MLQQSSVFVPVKLDYWEAYRTSVIVTAVVFRTFLYAWGVVALLSLGVFVAVLLKPASDAEWSYIFKNAEPLKWALGVPALFVFVLPLLTARLVLKDRIRTNGVTYQFFESEIHIVTVLSTTELSWDAIRRVIETGSAFLFFTGPNLAFTIPKRCLEDSQSLSVLREMIRSHVSKATLRRE
jgi:hypothetical protein